MNGAPDPARSDRRSRHKVARLRMNLDLYQAQIGGETSSS
jgi:hypothetical protein